MPNWTPDSQPPCASAEPQTTPRLQSFGSLLVLDAATLRVRGCSADTPGVLGVDAATLLGDSLCKYLTAAASKELTLFQHGTAERHEVLFTLPALRRRKLAGILHRGAGVLVLELLHGASQLPGRAAELTAERVAALLGSCHRALADARALHELHEQLAALALAHLGYAHVAVLQLEPARRFTLRAHAAAGAQGHRADADKSAKEALASELFAEGPCLGFAMVGDSEAASVTLLSVDPAEPLAAPPVGCLLRAPSQTCLAQLRAMGARSLLALPLAHKIDAKEPPQTDPPWGVLLCWDPRPQIPPAATRAFARSLTQLHAQQLSLLSDREATRLSALRVRTAIESSGEPICVLDTFGNTVLANAAFMSLTRQPSSALSNRYQLEGLLTHPGLPEQIAAGLSTGEGYWQGETAFRLPHGERVPIDLRVDVISQDDGAPVGFVAVCHDLRPHRQAEDRLRLLDSAIMNARVALLIARFPPGGAPHGVLVNPAFVELTQVAAERALTAPVDCVLGKEPDLAVAQQLAEALARNESRRVEYLFKRDGGEPFWADLRVFPSNAPTAQGTDLILTLWDVSEKKQAQADKREMERRLQENQNLDSLGVLAGGIAHDFNNLLTGILGNASLLRADVRRGKLTDSYLAQIEETALRAAELCKQMLAYAGKGQFALRELSINELVEETLSLLELGATPRQAVQLKAAGKLPPVLGDPAQLRQVLTNLVRNAAESLPQRPGQVAASGRSPSRGGRRHLPPVASYGLPTSPPRRQITVTTALVALDADALRSAYGNPAALPGEYVSIEVQDTGCGIPPEVQKRMFEPFFTTKRGCRGLGLSTVLGVVRGHGGVVRVRSELDRGSSFAVLLPACGPARLRAADEQDEAPAASSGPGRPLRAH